MPHRAETPHRWLLCLPALTATCLPHTGGLMLHKRLMSHRGLMPHRRPMSHRGLVFLSRLGCLIAYTASCLTGGPCLTEALCFSVGLDVSLPPQPHVSQRANVSQRPRVSQ